MRDLTGSGVGWGVFRIKRVAGKIGLKWEGFGSQPGGSALGEHYRRSLITE